MGYPMWTADVVEIGPSRLHQLNRHTGEGPDDEVGDCLRTAIACLLGYDRPDQVPHFVEQSIRAGENAQRYGFSIDLMLARKWLRRAEGLDLMLVDHDQAEALGVHYMAMVQSKAGPWGHEVVACAGEVVWCPTTGDVGVYTGADINRDRNAVIVTSRYWPPPELALAYHLNLCRREAS